MNNKSIEKLLVVVLLVITAITHWLSYNQTEFATGWDSYFYIIQVRSWLETGSMHSNEWSLIYPVIALFNLTLSNEIVAMKATSILLVLGFCGGCYWFTFSSSKSFSLAIASLVVASFSPELTYFAAQWPKNLLGVIITLLLFSSLINKQSRLALLLLLIGFFTHRMAAVLNIFLVISWIVYHRVSFKYFFIASILVVLVLIILHFVPGLLNFHDFERLNGLISSKFQYAPISFISVFGTSKIGLWWKCEMIIVSVMLLTLILKLLLNQLIYKPQPVLFCSIAMMLLLWFPFYSVNMDGIGYRLFHVGALFMPILLIQTINFKNLNWVLTAIFLILSFFSHKSYQPKKHDPPYYTYEKISLKIKENLNAKPELIIAHKGLADYIDYSLSIDAMSWVPEYRIEENKLLRVAYIPYPKLYSYYTKNDPTELRGDYYLLKESDWQLFISEVEKNEDSDLYIQFVDWKNPNKIRPKFLKK